MESVLSALHREDHGLSIQSSIRKHEKERGSDIWLDNWKISDSGKDGIPGNQSRDTVNRQIHSFGRTVPLRFVGIDTLV